MGIRERWLQPILVLMIGVTGSVAAAADTRDAQQDLIRVASRTDAPTDVLDALTPARRAELFRRAVAARMELERRQIVAEMRGSLIYDQHDVDRAVEILEAEPEGTCEDNLDRICRAFGLLEEPLRRANELIDEGEFRLAEQEILPALDPRGGGYLAATKLYLHARCLSGYGDHASAVEAYSRLLLRMPDRLSFAMESALQTADIYERLDRPFYALAIYRYALRNYGLSMTPQRTEEVEQDIARLEELLGPEELDEQELADILEDHTLDDPALEGEDPTGEGSCQLTELLSSIIESLEDRSLTPLATDRGEDAGETRDSANLPETDASKNTTRETDWEMLTDEQRERFLKIRDELGGPHDKRLLEEYVKRIHSGE